MDDARTTTSTNGSSCHLRWEERMSGLTSFLLKDFAKGTFLDATLSCRGNMKIRAHKLILAASSSFLASIFKSLAGQSSDDVTIIIPDFDVDTLDSLLRAVYRGEQFNRWSLEEELVVKAAETLAMIDIETSSLDINLDSLEYYDGSLSGNNNKVYLIFFGNTSKSSFLNAQIDQVNQQTGYLLLSLEHF